jgi:hypothetical protein
MTAIIATCRQILGSTGRCTLCSDRSGHASRELTSSSSGTDSSDSRTKFSAYSPAKFIQDTGVSQDQRTHMQTDIDEGNTFGSSPNWETNEFRESALFELLRTPRLDQLDRRIIIVLVALSTSRSLTILSICLHVISPRLAERLSFIHPGCRFRIHIQLHFAQLIFLLSRDQRL